MPLLYPLSAQSATTQLAGLHDHFWLNRNRRTLYDERDDYLVGAMLVLSPAGVVSRVGRTDVDDRQRPVGHRQQVPVIRHRHAADTSQTSVVACSLAPRVSPRHWHKFHRK